MAFPLGRTLFRKRVGPHAGGGNTTNAKPAKTKMTTIEVSVINAERNQMEKVSTNQSNPRLENTIQDATDGE